jgi:anti-sigma regulatory factor (Ser/Thr protein kinase)
MSHADVEVTESSALLLPFTASSVGEARRHLVADLLGAGVRGLVVTDAALVISELASNALQHGKPLPGEAIRVAWELDAGSVRVSVCDGGGPTLPELGEPTATAIGGRGLRIVARLARRWGTSNGPEGTIVWAEVQLGPAPAVAVPAAATESGLAGRRPAGRSGNSQLALNVVTWLPGSGHGRVGTWSLLSRVDFRMITPS